MASPSQVPAWHSVPLTYLRQPPWPSQVPSWPQVVGSTTTQIAGSAGFTPAGMKPQSPSDDERLQDLHLSLHADVQQTPSVQNPVWHSASHAQDSALPLVPLAALGGHDVR